MKKLLSILLAALILCLGGAVGASAALPEPGALEAQSLQFELPAVTAIEAVWNGEVLLDNWLEPIFTPENVAITVFFEEGEPEVLAYWSAGSSAWFWEVSYLYDNAEDSVLFWYKDSGMTDSEEFSETSIEFPANYLALFKASQDVTPLKLGEASAAVPCNGDGFSCKVFTFTPDKSGEYRFSRASTDVYTQRFFVLDADLNMLDWGSGVVVPLEAGKTYYVFVSSWEYYWSIDDDVESEYTVTVSEYNWWREILSLFGGMGFGGIVRLVVMFPFFLFGFFLWLILTLPSILFGWLF